MNKSLKNITFLALSSVLLLAVAGIVGGLFGKIVYYLAFIIPVLLYAVRFRKDGARPLKLYTDRGQIKLLLPLIVPSIVVIILSSALTTLILSLFGMENATAIDSGVFTAILDKALLPALLEESLYRYAFLAMLLAFSKKGAIFYSAIFFAFAHCDLFQIPYALVAGLIFAIVDVAFDSVLPSLIIHFLNNLISILWIFYYEGNEALFIATLALLFVISIILIFAWRKKYAGLFKSAFTGECAYFPTVTVFIGVTLLVAVSAII